MGLDEDHPVWLRHPPLQWRGIEAPGLVIRDPFGVGMGRLDAWRSVFAFGSEDSGEVVSDPLTQNSYSCWLSVFADDAQLPAEQQQDGRINAHSYRKWCAKRQKRAVLAHDICSCGEQSLWGALSSYGAKHDG